MINSDNYRNHSLLYSVVVVEISGERHSQRVEMCVVGTIFLFQPVKVFPTRQVAGIEK